MIVHRMGWLGTYLVPRLVASGFDVVNVSRGVRDPYQPRYSSLQAVYEAVQWLIETGEIRQDGAKT